MAGFKRDWEDYNETWHGAPAESGLVFEEDLKQDEGYIKFTPANGSSKGVFFCWGRKDVNSTAGVSVTIPTAVNAWVINNVQLCPADSTGTLGGPGATNPEAQLVDHYGCTDWGDYQGSTTLANHKFKIQGYSGNSKADIGYVYWFVVGQHSDTV